MDFFEAQARARRRSGRLILLFGLAVAATIAATHAAVWLLWNKLLEQQGRLPLTWWDPDLLLSTSSVVFVLVGGASLYKWYQLAQGGSAVAELVGARPIQAGGNNPAEQRLLNIVEEMAIASGLPVPDVYVMDDEPSINAFAAGLDTSDAVVAVTQGTLNRLNRDELQGVVAHEFSHILNGDMRTNIRITSLLFGVLFIGLIGRGLLESIRYVRVGSDSRRKDGGITVFLVLLGLALFVIGYVGYFFGRLVQAAVSRQREYLADASAVQFTRNPSGIVGALSKIGGYSLQSYIANDNGAQIRHFFFASGFRSWFGGMLDTHPPLPERIRLIDPSWDGRFVTPPQKVDIERQSFAQAGLAGLAPTSAQDPFCPNSPPLPPALIQQAGSLTRESVAASMRLLDGLPSGLREAAHTPDGAEQILLGLVAHTAVADPIISNGLSQLHPGARLPLAQLACAGLRQMDETRAAHTIDELRRHIEADQEVTPFELALRTMAIRVLRHSRHPAGPARFFSFNAVRDDLEIVLSAIAWSGATDQSTALAAFSTGVGQLPFVDKGLRFRTEAECGLHALVESFERLGNASLPIRKRLLDAASLVVATDAQILDGELELLRAVSAAVDCPLPLPASFA